MDQETQGKLLHMLQMHIDDAFVEFCDKINVERLSLDYSEQDVLDALSFLGYYDFANAWEEGM